MFYDNLAFYSDDEIESMLDSWIAYFDDNAPHPNIPFSFSEVEREYFRRDRIKAVIEDMKGE